MLGNELVVYERPKEHTLPLSALQRSFRTQIADLALRWIIPKEFISSFSLVNRVVRPVRDLPRNHLKWFHQSVDLTHLESIVRIIEGDFPEKSFLLALSYHFEALSVCKGSITDTHLNSDRDKSTLHIWSMLSYLTHCLELHVLFCPDLLEVIKRNLVDAIKKDLPLFKAILAYERCREEKYYLMSRQIDLKIRTFHGLVNCDEFRFHLFANFPETKEFDNICYTRLLTADQKIAKGNEIWNKLAQTDLEMANRVLSSNKVLEITSAANELDIKMAQYKSVIEARAPRMALHKVKKALQSLYEYEQLAIALEYTKVVAKQFPEDMATRTQWLIILREGLKFVVSDNILTIPRLKSIHKFASDIKEVRDYFEHPEDYETIAQEQENELFAQLKAMTDDIIASIETRLKKMEVLFRPHPQKDAASLYLGLITEEKEDPRESEKLKELRNYPGLTNFAASVKRTKRSEKMPEVQMRNALNGEIKELEAKIKGLSRDELIDRLKTDTLFRLEVQGKINSAERAFSEIMHSAATGWPDWMRRCLEDAYSVLRNARNFQTHDLWRNNTHGLVNSVYLIVHDIPQALNSLATVPFKNDSPEDKLFDEVARGDPTVEKLSQAILNGFNINCVDKFRTTLLHTMIDYQADPDLAKWIIEQGANIHIADLTGERPIHCAIRTGSLDLVRLLVEKGAALDIHANGKTLLEYAQENDQEAIAQFISEHLGISRSSSARMLLDAVKNLDVEKVRESLDQGFSPRDDFRGELPLVALFEKPWADEAVQLAIAEMLFAAGADINQRDRSSGKTALHMAARNVTSIVTIDRIMRQKPLVDVLDSEGSTPLHDAVLYKNWNWITCLLANGANVNIKSRRQQTPLLIASGRLRPSSRTVELLIAYGADVRAENRFGTVLHHLAEFGRQKMAKTISIVLAKGASPFALGRDGVYWKKRPIDVAKVSEVQQVLQEKMDHLMSHVLD